MTWRARKSTVLLAFFPLLAGLALTVLTYRTAEARSEVQKDDPIEKVVAYLKGKKIQIKEDKLKKVVHAVYRESRHCDLDYRLALAVIKAESNFQQNAVSNKGARGLMQIMPSLAKYIAKDAGVKYSSEQCLHTPEKNIKLGVYHLSRLVEDFKNLPTALHAYNAGETRVRARKSKKEPRTAYTKEVIEEYERSLIALPDAKVLGEEVSLFADSDGQRVTETKAALGEMALFQLPTASNVSDQCRIRGVLQQSQFCLYTRVLSKGESRDIINGPRMPKPLPNELLLEVKEKLKLIAHTSFGRTGVLRVLRCELLVSASSARGIWLREDLQKRHTPVLRI